MIRTGHLAYRTQLSDQSRRNLIVSLLINFADLIRPTDLPGNKTQQTGLRRQRFGGRSNYPDSFKRQARSVGQTHHL